MTEAPIVPIVGGGPAGMSCALWLKTYGLRPLIVEREMRLGGMQRASPYPNLGLLGAPGRTARENADGFERHIEAEQIETLRGCAPARVRALGGGFALDLEGADGTRRTLESAMLVIATGTSFRGSEWLDRVSGAHALADKGSVLPNPALAGEPGVELGGRVLIVGGGDNAFDVAHQIARPGRQIAIAMRAAAPGAQPILVERARDAAIKTNATVMALSESAGAVAVRFADGSALEVDRIVLCLGFSPNTREPWIAGLGLKIDNGGHIAVDANMETTRHDVFAIGDVANPRNPCTVSALASGAAAAREIHNRLTAPHP